MLIVDFEKERAAGKPKHIEVLFVGESRPRGGNFFYNEDSALFRETRKAFNEYFNQDIFTLDNFKQWNCWLYDICDMPVNGLPKSERKECIHNNIPHFVELVRKINPKYIIVCKKDFVEREIKKSVVMNSYTINENIFFLPFPGFGNQKKYREGLVKTLQTLDFKKHN